MEILLAVVVIILLCFALLYAGQRFKIPSVVTFLLIGIIVGPYGLGVVDDMSLIAMFGELGVILLLFTIGLEFSFEKLLGAWRAVVIGGAIQVCTTIIAITAIMSVLGWSFNVALFFGFLVSLSSTAIVMKVLQERGEIETLPGRTMLGILIFQDLAIIPMILISPVLLGTGAVAGQSLPIEVAKVAVILVLILIMAHWIIPAVLTRVARQRSRELFFVTITGICLLVAWLTESAGLSLTLGAFLAGLIIGESDYSIDALSNIIPFRDVFAAVFFISIGMLLNLRVAAGAISVIALVVLTIIGVKIFTGSLSAAVLRLPARTVVATGLALFQIGEFSFVLAKIGLQSDLIPDTTYQVFLAGAIATMALTPFVMTGSRGIMDRMYRISPSLLVSLKIPESKGPDEIPVLSDHLIIAGFGITGKSVARAAEIAGIPYAVIDLNPETIRTLKEQDEERAFFGDATQPGLLLHAGIARARALVITISDRDAIPRVVRNAKQLAPDVSVIARTRYIGDADKLLELGADEVIPEEFETSIGIFSRILMKYGLPEDEIAKFSARIRGRGYRLFTRTDTPDGTLAGAKIKHADIRFHTLRAAAGSPVVGKTLEELDFPSLGLHVLAVRHGDIIHGIPKGDTTIGEGDLVIIYGDEEHLPDIITLFSGTMK
jgi:monovalent cation:H+ antiporter-2, CPA2 family